MYADAAGGAPLWQEVQNVQLDQQGHFSVLLGASTKGGYRSKFSSSGSSLYLGAQPMIPGETENPRVLMVSVPFALRASDAETRGGLPPSAFARAMPNVSIANSSDSNSAKSLGVIPAGPIPGSPPSPQDTGVTSPGGTVNTVPKFAAAASIIDSQITDSNNIVSVQNLANILFADRFPNGVSDAMAACPSSGCTIYAGSPNVNLNLGTLDSGNKAITIYLGPYIYNINQIVLRRGLKIIGMGASGGAAGTITCLAAPCNGTALKSVNGNNPVIVLPQDNNDPATDVLLSGFRILGSTGNTGEDGILLDTSALTNSGLWHSTLKDLYLEGFAGIGIHLKGPNNNFGAISQWVHFDDVTVFRAPGGGNGLRLEGANFEIEFSNCQVDGSAIGDGTNIYIGGLAGGINGYPLNIKFSGLVTQAAAVGVQIDGAAGISFYSSHHEKLWGVYSITNNTNIGTKGVTITDANFFGVGSNNGAGYLLNVGTSLASGIVFAQNQVLGSPDSVITGTNLSQVVYRDNLYYDHSVFNVPPTSGITTQISPAATMDIGGAHTVGLNPSSTTITTIQSSLGPGEMVTFFLLAGTATFGTGGNISLPGTSSVVVSGSITFVRNDLTGANAAWTPVAQWTPTASGNPPPNSSDFSVSATPSSATVVAGGAPTFNLLVTPVKGFNGAVQFTCTGVPTKSSVQFLPTLC